MKELHERGEGALQDEGTSRAKHRDVKQPLSEIKVKKWMEAVIDLGSSHLSYSPLQLTGASVSSVGPCGTKLMSHPGWSGSSHA